MKRRRVLRRLAATFLILLTVVAVLFITAGSSGTVLRWLVAFVDDRLPVQLEEVEGSLLRGLRVGKLSGTQDGIEFLVEDLELVVDWRCALQSQLCIELIKAQQVDLRLPPTAPDIDASQPAGAAFWPPDTVLENLVVKSLSVSQGETTEQINTLQLTAEADAKGISVTRFSGAHRYGHWRAGGRYARSGDWRGEMTLDASEALQGMLGKGLPPVYRLRADGDTSSVSASLLPAGDVDLGMELQVDGLASDLTWSATIRHGSLFALRGPDSLQGWVQPSGPLYLGGSYQADILTARLRQELDGFGPGPTNLKVELRVEDRLLQLVDARLEHEGDATLELAGDLGSLDQLQPSLSAVLSDFRAPDAAGLPLADLSGSLDLLVDPARGSYRLQTGELKLRLDERRFRISGNLMSGVDPLLPLGELRLSTFTEADSGTGIEATYRRVAEQDPAAIALSGDLTAGELALNSIALAITSGEERQIDASLKGDVEGELLALATVSSDGVSLQLNPVSVTIVGEELRMPQAVAAQWTADSGLLVVEPLCLLWRNSRLCTEPTTLGESGELVATLGVDEEYAGQWADQPFRMAGRGGGNATLAWSDGVLTRAGFDLVLDALSFDPLVATDSAVPLSWQRVEVRGALEETRFIDAKLRSQALGDMDLSLHEDDGSLTGFFKASSLAMRPWADLIPELGVLGGTGTADVKVAGSLEVPQFHGNIELHSLDASIAQAGTSLDEAELTLQINGQDLSISGSGLLGGGQFQLAGTCCEDGRLSAQVSGTDNSIGLASGLSARLSPELDLSVSTDAIGVRGLVTVHEGVFEHRSPRDEGVAISPDIQRVDEVESGSRRFAFDADLRTVIEPRFTLRSKEIESTLAGDLRVLVKDRQPMEVYGDLRVLGGELRALGQVLRLSEGVVGFVGDPMNPNLNLSAEREVRAEGLRVGFNVQGNLEAPDLTLFSDPQRSERDTLSYLLRGRGPDAGATVDSTAMALSLGATAVNRSGVLRSLESIPGLSDVSIGAEGSDDELAATISAYVGRRLFLSYGVGLYEPVNALTARLYLQSRLWLEVVSRLESSFDLYYRFERN